MSQYILYDLPSKGRCACWSLNPWKTRLAFNFKNIDYKTEWVEYPDIAPKLKTLVAPNDPSQNPVPFSIPTVKFPSGETIMDSKAIAEKLEAEHSSPPLHLDSAELKAVEEVIPKIRDALRGVWLPPLPGKLLNPSSAEYFRTTRAKRYGMPLEQIAKEQGGEEAWISSLPPLKELASIISAKGGPFCLGETPSYADFNIVSILHFFKVIDEEIYQRITSIDPAFTKLYEASKKWLERDDH